MSTSPSAAKGSILVTGANGGLGSAIAASLAESQAWGADYHGLYGVRSAATATALHRSLSRAASLSHQHDVIELDLSRLDSVRKVAADINRRVAEGSLPRLRALILNAAYMEGAEQCFTPDGFDMSWQVNYLAHFVLTLLLLQSMDKEHGRVIVIGSYGHNPLDKRNSGFSWYTGDEWKSLYHNTESLARGTWSSSKDYPTTDAGIRRYGAGKLCLIMMMHELQSRLTGDPTLSSICALAVDPGGMGSSLFRRSNFLLRVIAPPLLPLAATVMSLFAENPQLRLTQRSAGDVLRAVFDTQVLGEYPRGVYLDGRAPASTSEESQDIEKRTSLWSDSVRLTNIADSDTALAKWQ
ncbi:putative short-chain dehydrogenase [Lasiosphaeria ovina]|uniref:Short-chain dehydrogenase n=1 Tax=Lasiosphaeria ovina TaxID=92902 RepID=A0AAE0JU84_9PEZI|nr:putative short-chain dehydrogenase [Lasiosphaeria ovina]